MAKRNDGGDPKKKVSLPTISMGTIKKPTLDSAAQAVTPHGDTIWLNTGSRARGGMFWHPRDENGQPKDRRYLTEAQKAAVRKARGE